MREIKFRAWDKKETVMCWVRVINLEKGAFLVGNSATPMEVYEKMIVKGIKEGHFVEFGGIELMQYTGLKDRNRKDIYEGDVLRNPEGKTGEVVFNDGSFRLQIHKSDTSAHYITMNEEYCRNKEIIGNIYENPELVNPTLGATKE